MKTKKLDLDFLNSSDLLSREEKKNILAGSPSTPCNCLFCGGQSGYYREIQMQCYGQPHLRCLNYVSAADVITFSSWGIC